MPLPAEPPWREPSWWGWYPPPCWLPSPPPAGGRLTWDHHERSRPAGGDRRASMGEVLEATPAGREAPEPQVVKRPDVRSTSGSTTCGAPQEAPRAEHVRKQRPPRWHGGPTLGPAECAGAPARSSRPRC